MRIVAQATLGDRCTASGVVAEDQGTTPSSEYTYAIVVADISYQIPHLKGHVSANELLAHAVDVPLPADTNPFEEPYPWSLRSEFLQGGCDLFACALRTILPEGEILAMEEPDMQDRSRKPMLIHAGLLLDDDHIVDVLGVHDLADWKARWRRVAETRKWSTRIVNREDLDVLQGCRPGERMTHEAVAAVVPHALFVAHLVGLVPLICELQEEAASILHCPGAVFRP